MAPTTKFFALCLAVVSIFVLSGMTECGPCPDTYHFVIESGVYAHESTFILGQEPQDAIPLPHFGATNLELRLDTVERTAVVEYRKEG